MKSAIAMAGLYKGGNLNLKLRPPEVLPKSLRDKIFSTKGNETEEIKSMLREKLTQQEKELIFAFCCAGTGQFSVYLKARKVSANIDVSIPGLSGFFVEENHLKNLSIQQEEEMKQMKQQPGTDQI